MRLFLYSLFFFFNDTATTEIYTLSLHDALPISAQIPGQRPGTRAGRKYHQRSSADWLQARSEEHTSELQSLAYLVCRLLLEKKKKEPSKSYTQRTEVTHKGTRQQMYTPTRAVPI